MDLTFGPEYEAFRVEVKKFLADGWPLSGAEAKLPDAERAAIFRKRGIEAGYVYRNIPKAYGGSEQSIDVLKDRIIAEEYAAAKAPGGLLTQGAAMLAPTLVEVGSEEQKQRYIPKALAGEEIWCQGYSEPGSGSDLASLTSSAVLSEDGSEWIVNGHKIWTSSADNAQMMFGLFRTEPDAGKHAGISYLLLSMDSPGIEIRPLVEMTGGALFSEVRFNDVRVPAGNIVGQRGEGWKISKVTLKYERNMIGDPNGLRNLFERVVTLAKERTRGGKPVLEDPHVRQRFAEIEGALMSQENTSRRMLTASMKGEVAKVALPMLMMKLYGTNTRGKITRLAWDLLGGEGMLAPDEGEYIANSPDTPPAWNSRMMSSVAVAIAGGASNIQRNIIGERGLGLPRDLRAG